MSDSKTYQKILAIDGSTQICTVALRSGPEIFYRQEIGMGIHSTAIFTQIKEILAQAEVRFNELDAIIIGYGPGSYTGLRVVASSVKGLLFSKDIPLFGINSLAGFAACAIEKPSGVIHSIIDARRNHVYYQRFSVDSSGSLKPDTAPDLIEIPDLYSKVLPQETVIGTGLERLERDKLQGISLLDPMCITAKGLLYLFDRSEIGKSTLIKELDPEDFEPNYEIQDFGH